MKTETLQGLVEIVHEKSIRKAAQNLNIPQQTLNKNITALETELSVRILERTNRGVQLTDAGAEVYQFAKWCLHENALLYKNIKTSDNSEGNIESQKKELVVGCVNTAIQNIMSKAFAKLYQSKNNILSLSVVQDTSMHIVEKVLRDEYQIGIALQYCSSRISYPIFDDSLKFIPIYYSKPYVWVSKKSYLAGKKFLSEEDISQHTILRLKDNDVDMTNFVFEQNKLKNLNVILCENIYYAANMLNMNLGIALDMKTNKRLNLEKSLSDIAVALPVRYADSYQMITGILVKKTTQEIESIKRVIDFLIQQNNK